MNTPNDGSRFNLNTAIVFIACWHPQQIVWPKIDSVILGEKWWQGYFWAGSRPGLTYWVFRAITSRVSLRQSIESDLYPKSSHTGV